MPRLQRTRSSRNANPTGARRPVARRPPCPAVAALWRVALAGAGDDGPGLATALERARAAGWSRRALEETALMLTLYSGFPAAIETLRVLASRWPTRVRPLGEGAPASRRDRGLRVLARVYGPVRPALLRGLDQLHPALAAWVVEHGYGRVLARPGLGLRARELVTVAMLAASGWERQLTSHVLGAGRAGATDAEVETAVREGRLAGAGRRHGHAVAPLPSTEATPALRLARLRASTRRRTRAPRAVRADRSPAARTPGRR